MATVVKRDEILAGLKSQIEGHREEGGKLVVTIGKCTFYSVPSSRKYESFTHFIKTIVHKNVDNRDASCFNGKYGILYSWLYLVDPTYIDKSSGPQSMFGELSVRLGLLMLEYNVYAETPIKERTSERREYFKYTDFAVKRVCVQIIHELIRAQNGTIIDDNKISDAYEIYPQIRKSLPFTILIALANRFMTDTETVKIFAAKFAEIIKYDAPAKVLIPSFYEFGVVIANYMIEKYGIIKSIAPIAAAPEVRFAVKKSKRTVKAKEVRLDLTEEFKLEPSHPPVQPDVITTTTTTTIEAVATVVRRTEVIAVSKKKKKEATEGGVHREAISACAACDTAKPPETNIMLTEGRIAGATYAAVDYEKLESATWRKMGPVGDSKNFARIVGFIHEVLSPMRSIQASSVENLAFSLLPSDEYEQNARDVIVAFICGVEFINLNFNTLAFKSEKTVKKAMDELLDKKPLFADRTHRILFARLLMQQLFKQMIDADECESRMWSDRYKSSYGMIAHVVGNVWYVQRNLVKLVEFDPAWKTSIIDDLVKRVNRRFFDTLYAARLTCDSISVVAWQQWKDAFFIDYATIHSMVIAKITEPDKHPGEFPFTPKTALSSVKTRTFSKTMDAMLKRAESMISVPIKKPVPEKPDEPVADKLGFVVQTPDFDEPAPMGNLPQISEDDEKEQEARILNALKEVNDGIGNERSTHRKRELREAITGVSINRSFTCKDFSYQDIVIGHVDYSHGQFGGEIHDFQAFLSKLYLEQTGKEDPMQI